MTNGDDAVADGYRRRKLGSRSRSPRILACYSGALGWASVKGLRLDGVVARRLLGEGVTLVRVKRGLRTIELGLSRYLGPSD